MLVLPVIAILPKKLQEVGCFGLLFGYYLPTATHRCILRISPSLILMFHSEADSILPYKLGLELYPSAKQLKQ